MWRENILSAVAATVDVPLLPFPLDIMNTPELHKWLIPQMKADLAETKNIVASKIWWSSLWWSWANVSTLGLKFRANTYCPQWLQPYHRQCWRLQVICCCCHCCWQCCGCTYYPQGSRWRIILNIQYNWNLYSGVHNRSLYFLFILCVKSMIKKCHQKCQNCVTKLYLLSSDR